VGYSKLEFTATDAGAVVILQVVKQILVVRCVALLCLKMHLEKAQVYVPLRIHVSGIA
jgi:hypothetical protein